MDTWHLLLTLILAVYICSSDCCSVNEFECQNDGHCIPRHLRCNGVDDCGDNSDEDETCLVPTPCFGDEFQCSNGTCLSHSVRCDGVHQCGDSSDEEGCNDHLLIILAVGGSFACLTICCGCACGCIKRHLSGRHRVSDTPSPAGSTTREGALSTTSAGTDNQTEHQGSFFLDYPRPQRKPPATHVEILISEPPPSYDDAFMYDKPELQVYPQSKICLEFDLSEMPPPAYPGSIPESEQ